jgi:hypothetical protein
VGSTVDFGGYQGRRSNYGRAASECSVDRRDWRGLSVEEFNHEYYDEGRPVVLYGEGG